VFFPLAVHQEGKQVAVQYPWVRISGECARTDRDFPVRTASLAMLTSSTAISYGPIAAKSPKTSSGETWAGWRQLQVGGVHLGDMQCEERPFRSTSATLLHAPTNARSRSPATGA